MVSVAVEEETAGVTSVSVGYLLLSVMMTVSCSSLVVSPHTPMVKVLLPDSSAAQLSVPEVFT